MKPSALQQAIQFIGEKLGLAQPKIISPIPDYQVLTPALENYYKMDQMKADAAHKWNIEHANDPTPTPMQIHYPEWMANAPAKKTAVTITPTPGGANAQVLSAQTKRKPSGYETILSNLQKGFAKYGNPPIASHAADLAQLGYEVAQKGGDPYLPAALTLKETGGLSYGPAQAINNPAGIGPGIKYPDLTTAILGGGTSGINGGPQKGMRGVLFNGLYDDYYKSGNLQDFFKHYTPADAPGHNNPSYNEQINLMNQLLGYFE